MSEPIEPIEEELVSINPDVFIKIILHTFRYWPVNGNGGEKAMVFGLLLGRIEGNTRVIKKIEPITHQKESEFEMDEEFLKNIEDINRREFEMGALSEVVGWYRSSDQGIKFSAKDIKNHLNFQSKNSKYIALIFDPHIFLKQEGHYGFSIFRLKGESYYNIMSDYYKIAWEIGTIESSEQILMDFRRYIKNYYENKPLITEINEVE